MWLLIDDSRDLNCEVIAKTAAAGKKLLAVKGWECLCIDHDLGGSETGYDVIQWALLRGYVPPRVQIVSSNPVGRKNIAAALEAAKYTTKDGINFQL